MPEFKMINMRKVPEECHRQVKLAAADAEVTMADWVLGAIMEKLVRIEAEKNGKR